MEEERILISGSGKRITLLEVWILGEVGAEIEDREFFVGLELLVLLLLLVL